MQLDGLASKLATRWGRCNKRAQTLPRRSARQQQQRSRKLAAGLPCRETGVSQVQKESNELAQ